MKLDNSITQFRQKQEVWAQRIKDAHSATVESIIHIGQLLIEAKADCSHGEWGELTGQTTGKPMIRFSYRTVQRYMAIARHPVLSNATMWSHLPASWRALYELSKLEESALERNIENGDITPNLTVNGAIALCRFEAINSIYERLTELHLSTIKSIVEMGQLFFAANDDCNSEEWEELTGQTTGKPMIRFSYRTVQRYMAIAKHPVLSNATMWPHLPPDFEVLSELSKLDPKLLELSIENGSIFIDMEIDDVNAVRALS